jgi:SAM-dependent methyltransferase
MTNLEQREYWDGAGGEHWREEAERYEALNRRFGARLLEALAPAEGERVLEVGCGNGGVAVELARRVGPSGAVLGLDLSGPMLANARHRAAEAGLDHLRFEQGDAQVCPFEPGSFDAVTSRFGVMFFDDPVAAFGNLARAVRGGGRLAVLCWQDLLRNEWLTVPVGAALAHVPMPELGDPGAPGPFALADPDRLSGVLREAGWADVMLDDVEEPMVMGGSLDDTVAFMQRTDMAATLMKDVPEDAAAAAWAAVREALAPYAGDDGVVLRGRAWLATAVTPG